MKAHYHYSPNKVLDKNSKNAVASAAKELRRNYAKRVIDKLAMLTKNSLKILGPEFNENFLSTLESFPRVGKLPSLVKILFLGYIPSTH